MNDHFYKKENLDVKDKKINKKFMKKKSIVPVVIETNYYNLMYSVKKHYFTHHDV